jgi:hypothetical protein
MITGELENNMQSIVDQFQHRYERGLEHHDVNCSCSQACESKAVTYRVKFIKPTNGSRDELQVNIDSKIDCATLQSVQVRFLSYQNSGKPSIAKFTQSLIERYKQNNIYRRGSEDFDEDKVKESISQEVSGKILRHSCSHTTDYKKNIFPEPELLLLLSPICVLYGFPPLHLRYTEIL